VPAVLQNDVFTVNVAEPTQSFTERVPLWPVRGAENADSMRSLGLASQRRTRKGQHESEPDQPHGHLVEVAGGSLADPKVKDNHARRISMKIVRRRFVLKITDS